MWGTADPSNPGPFQVTTEENVGPEAGIPDPKFNNTLRHFNLYRPTDLSQGYCHPIVTWANGTNDQPKTYEVLIKQLASHGFVVVASLNSQTAQGTPLPQIVGIDWLIEQSNDPTSPLYHHLDTAHIGATGHSQGGAATTMAGADPRITAIAPIAGSRPDITLHGPAALLCGGMDTAVPCSSVKMAYDTISNVPVMLGDNLGDTHGSWIGSIKNPYMVAVTGWFRVHLMGDTANRGMFYGPSCKLCTDSHWQIQRKSMDQ
jgi:predicted dienelactone hydrolase